MIVALGLPLNVAAIIPGCILSMLLSVFSALGPISIPTPPTDALTEFFHADTVTSIHPLPVSWYLISSVWVYRCSCIQIMSILCSTADAVSSGSWPILFKVLTLNVAICIVCLHFSSVWTHPFFTRAKSDVVCVCGLSMSHGYLSMAVFILIYRSHSYRWAAVVARSNWQSWAARLTRSGNIRYCVFEYLHVHDAAFWNNLGIIFPSPKYLVGIFIYSIILLNETNPNVNVMPFLS